MTTSTDDAQRKAQIDVRLKFLLSLYKALPDQKEKNIRIGDFLKGGLKPSTATDQAVQLGYLKWNGRRGPYSRWQYLAGIPTSEMAEKMYDLLNKGGEASAKTSDTEGQTKDERALEFLEGIYALMKGAKNPILAKDLRLSEQALKHKLYPTFLTALQGAQIIEKIGHGGASVQYKWLAGKPNAKMVTLVFETEKAAVTTSNKKTKEKMKNKNKPLKGDKTEKAAVTTSNKSVWKEVAHKAIDMDDPVMALKALSKL